MQAIVKNIGSAASGDMVVKYWASVNAPEPAFTREFPGLAAGDQHIFSFQYDGYESWYSRITMKLEVNLKRPGREVNKTNNVLTKSYQVKRR